MGRAESAITDPTSPDLPESVSVLSIKLNVCHGTLVAPGWLLTAAHCFRTGTAPVPSDVFSVTTFGRHFHADDVVFHPKAWADQMQVWVDARTGVGVNYAFDVALVRLDALVVDRQPARLYHPAVPPDLAGMLLTFGGAGGTGTEQIVGAQMVGQGKMLIATAGTPSGSEPGDSGGGAFVALPAPMPASVGSYLPCAVTPADPPATVLAGVASTTVSGQDRFVAADEPAIVEWILKTSAESDGDGVCDDVDNCLRTKNAGQTNCNVLAETHPSAWQSNGVQLGDACDPAPCPQPSLQDTDFVRGDPGLDQNLFVDYGRQIADSVALEPVLDDGSGPLASEARPLFCMCRDVNGVPIPHPEICTAAPHFCVLDPLQAASGVEETGGGLAPAEGQTYWHRVSLDFGSKLGSLKLPLAITYPGATVERRWDYQQDYLGWLSQGWVQVLAQDPLFGDGTDLGGAMWAHDDTTAGATAAHGSPEQCSTFGGDPGQQGLPLPCSIADGFTYGVAPDRKVVRSSGFELPQIKPAPWWTYCAPCLDAFSFPGEQMMGPAPFVTLDPASLAATVWLQSGGQLTDVLSLPLRQALADTDGVWVAPSEPVALRNAPGLPRALRLSADGTQVLSLLTRSAAGFGLAAVGGSGMAPRGMAPRTGFAAAYSRTAGMLLVAGGRDLVGEPAGDLWTWSVLSGGWSTVPLQSQGPLQARAAVFSQRDWRLWVVDERPEGLRLLRIDPATGAVVSFTALGVLEGASDVWLTSLEDGRVLLAVNAPLGRLRLLGATPFADADEVQVLSALDLDGKLAMQPAVGGGVISTAIEVEAAPGKQVLQTETLPVAELETAIRWPKQAVVALNSIALRAHSAVTGGVAVMDASPGPVLADQAEVMVGTDAVIGGSLWADSVRIRHGGVVTGLVGYNELTNHGTVEGELSTPLALPLDIALPPPDAVSAGTAGITVPHGQSVRLAAGAYGAVELKSGTKLAPTRLGLVGGRYDLRLLRLGGRSRLECESSCLLRIAERVRLGHHAFLGPGAGSRAPAMLQIEVMGSNGQSGGLHAAPKAVRIGEGSELRARIFAPSGTLRLGHGVRAFGTFIARDVDVGPHVVLGGDGGW